MLGILKQLSSSNYCVLGIKVTADVNKVVECLDFALVGNKTQKLQNSPVWVDPSQCQSRNSSC